MQSKLHGSVPQLFFTAGLIAAVLFLASKTSAEATNPSTIRLIGTITSKDFIGAVINGPEGEQTFYRLYAKLPDGTQIVEVRNKSIQLKDESGTRYDVYINNDVNPPGATPQSTRLEAPRPQVAPTSNAEAGQPNPRRGKSRRHSSTEED